MRSRRPPVPRAPRSHRLTHNGTTSFSVALVNEWSAYGHPGAPSGVFPLQALLTDGIVETSLDEDCPTSTLDEGCPSRYRTAERPRLPLPRAKEPTAVRHPESGRPSLLSSRARR